MDKLFLLPGNIYCGKDPKIIHTVLGSCVSIILYDPQKKLGGINHYLLPTGDDMLITPLRYGEKANQTLLDEVFTLGARRSKLVAGIYGGANISEEANEEVGVENIRCAEEFLSSEGIRIVEKEVGGNSSRKIVFNLTSGEVELSAGSSEESELDLRVFILDASKSERTAIKKMINDKKITVVGEDEDPARAWNKINEIRPDILILDVNLPKIDGRRFLGAITNQLSLPTLVFSDRIRENKELSGQCYQLGASQVMDKPYLENREDYQKFKDLFKKSLTHIFSRKKSSEKRNCEGHYLKFNAHNNRRLIAIASSTGGPKALKDILPLFPKNSPPIVVVQHMPPGEFVAKLVESINKLCRMDVKVARPGEFLQHGTIYFAPGDQHIEVRSKNGRFYTIVHKHRKLHNVRPAADYLFASVAEHASRFATGIILTGMGNDGAEGARKMKQKGCYIVAQNANSSVVFGMAKRAIEIGVVDKVLSLNLIPKCIVDYYNKSAFQK